MNIEFCSGCLTTVHITEDGQYCETCDAYFCWACCIKIYPFWEYSNLDRIVCDQCNPYSVHTRGVYCNRCCKYSAKPCCCLCGTKVSECRHIRDMDELRRIGTCCKCRFHYTLCLDIIYALLLYWKRIHGQHDILLHIIKTLL
jgi:hypothetical protein